jgi:ubiquinol-cytochrome c reductase cytochrome b subunit
MSLGDWLNERTGHRALVRDALDEPVPGGARWAYVWGSALTLSLVVQTVTGWLLMSAYSPSATNAWASVHHITYTMRAGWLIRGVHHFGAQAMVVLLALHLGQTALYGAYRKPREMNWFFGLGLAGVTLGFALTGYLLPWDQKGYWATRVATNIAGTIPGIGTFTQDLLVGGSEYGHMTLTRFYTLHVGVLPALTVALLAVHVALFRKHGITPPSSADTSKVDLFYPRQVGKDLAVALVVMVIIFGLALVEHGAPLDAPADAASDYPARPEWYFLALFEMLKYFHGALEPVGAVGVPAVVIGYLLLLPFVDRTGTPRADGKPRSTFGGRLVFLFPLLLVFLGAGALTVKSLRADAGDKAFQESRKVASERASRAIALAKAGIPPEGPLAMLRNDPETRGAELFEKTCASCHRLGKIGPPEGKDTAPDLTGWRTKKWVTAVLTDPDAPNLFGKTPFKEQMPSFVKPPADPEAAKLFTALKPEEIDEIGTFLVGQSKGDKGEGSPGEKLVKTRCTSCHRLDGKTDDEESLAPELRGWASLAWTDAQIADPGSGKTYPKGVMDPKLEGHMPAFGEKLSEKDRKILSQWVWSKAGE